VVGRVVALHVADGLLAGETLDFSGIRRTGRVAGTSYVRA
jgi:hypothetical protein